VIEFRHGDTTDQTYTLQSGTVVKTQGSDPKAFNTIRGRSIRLFDDFESGNLSGYQGGSVAFDVVSSDNVTPDAIVGDNMLSPSDGALPDQKTYTTSNDVRRGSVFDFHVYTEIGTAVDFGHMFAVQDDQNYYEIQYDTVGQGDDFHRIVKVEGGSETTLVEETATLDTGQWVRNEVRWDSVEDGRIVSRLIDGFGNEVSEITITDEATYDEGGFGFHFVEKGSAGSNWGVYWDKNGMRTAIVDARADEAGPSSNVAANTLNTVPSVPSGVSTVTNPYPMGDPSYALSTLAPFSSGREREDDETFRERITESADGKATLNAIIDNVRALPEAISVSGFQNKTTDDNTGTGGLPPKSFEIVYYGNDSDSAVAEAIFETQAVTSRDYGGANGTAASGTYTAENGQPFTVNWTEPSEVSINVTVDIVVDGTYIGDDELADRLTEIVGGERTDGSTAIGLGAGEDIYVDQIEDEIVGVDDTGVIGISSISFTPSTTTDGNGLSIVSVSNTEVPILDAENVTFNTTTV
jgi:hypothetical protein